MMPSSIHPDYHDVVWNRVDVNTTHFEFLRVHVNDEASQFRKLCDIISSFQFPPLPIRLPLTALRRICNQCLTSRIRPHLSFQPISRAHAEQLDQLIAHKIHAYTSFPFHFNSRLLFLPLRYRGFAFTSISTLNDSLSVAGLTRDLNHHLPVYRSMALITLADWTCAINHCQFPFHSNSSPRSFMRFTAKLPFAWLAAHAALSLVSISLRQTDQSCLFTGDVALRHILRASPEHVPQLSSTTVSNLERAGFTHLSHLGAWAASTDDPLQFHFRPHSHVPFFLRFTSASTAWPAVQCWLQQLSIPLLSQCLFQSLDDWMLALPRTHRETISSLVLTAIARCSPCGSLGANTVASASDASMLPPSPSILESRAVISAVVSYPVSFVTSLSSFRLSHHILHGELLAMIGAILQMSPVPLSLPCTAPNHLPDTDHTYPRPLVSSSSLPHLNSHPSAARLHPNTPLPSESVRPVLFTDHLNSVRLLNDAVSHSPPPYAWTSLPARSLYRWLLKLLQRSQSPLLVYTPAHTGSISMAAQLNDAADHLATSSQHFGLPPPPAPVPTFALDQYSLFSPTLGYFEGNISSLFTDLLAKSTTDMDGFLPSTVLAPRFLYDDLSPPEHPYIRASSAFSALVQLYARSSQLHTARTCYRRLGNVSPRCSFACVAYETVHHLFVECPHFEDLRSQALHNIRTETSRLLTEAKTPLPITEVIHDVVDALFRDNANIWPHVESRFYMGALPRVSVFDDGFFNTTAAQRLRIRLTHLWHTACIQLAARIWARYDRTLRERRQPHRSSGRKPIHLPHHLRVLLDQ